MSKTKPKRDKRKPIGPGCAKGANGETAVIPGQQGEMGENGETGGDGGRGGHIIIKGNNQLWTLLHLKYKKHIKEVLYSI